MRRALAAAGFRSDLPGTLPVLHYRLHGPALQNLPRTLEEGFAALQPLTVPGTRAWVEVVRWALEADPSWELPGRPKATPEVPRARAGGADAGPPLTAPSRRRRRRRRRFALLPLAFAATFALGLVSGFLLVESPPPEAQRAAPTAPPQGAAAPPSAAPEEAGAAAPTAAPAEPPSVMPRWAAPAAEGLPPAVLPPLPSTTDAAAAPVEAPADSAPHPATPAEDEGPVATAPTRPLEPSAAPERAAEILPAPQPQATKAPVRAGAARTRRPAPVLDPACSEAMLRFQQSERLTSAEQAFVRAGCTAIRR